ncbi:hypothetical protein [Thiobaca trueperi]|uniref:Uncharacterized protein n=1 Tax=Thiobaca trueperi TaxID=127458 RepID=A0A4R3MUV4_9GAMM|nr:hypothetical protein [Thiobaca trueperi]TCT20280.1 hypothetical protein EDC35_106207 [Thiobaca trueperi]
MSKPAHLPRDVWNHANVIRAAHASNPASWNSLEVEALNRLLDSKYEKLWRDLSSQGVADPLSWSLILNQFIGSAPGAGFQPDLQAEIKRARKRQADIAELSGQLADLLHDHLEHTAHRALSTPTALSDTQTLLEASGWRLPRFKHWEEADVEKSLRTVPPAALLAALAQAAEESNPTPMYPHQAHATVGYTKLVRSWVHAFDAAFAVAAVSILPPDLWIGHETLALIARAILEPHIEQDSDISADLIRHARKMAPPFQPGECVIFY